MDNEKKDFVIDVAKDRTYQNQNEDYRKAYEKWRSEPDNPYAYSYVHDTREHSYVAGEGFLKYEPDAAEHAALHKCLGFLGVVMIVMFIFDLVNFLLVRYAFPNSTGNILYFSNKLSVDNEITVGFAVLFSIISVLRYIAAIVLFKTVTKIPVRVALPHSKNNSLMIFHSAIIMLLIMVIGRLATFMISRFMSVVNLDSVYIYMMHSDDPAVQAISSVLNCILLPILCEVFYRGFVMQTFRQFDDSFAVIVSAFVCGFTFYDFSYIGYAICCSVVLGIFTIRAGSVYTAIIMHICSSTVNYLLASLSLVNETWATIIETSVCTLITAGALVVYSKLNERKNWSYNISSDRSGMPFSKKIKVMISTNTLAVWLVCSLVLSIVGARVL